MMPRANASSSSGPSTSSRRTANSSPPSRASKSPSRMLLRSRCTTARNSTSPSSWPSVSLTILNRSRSSSSSATFLSRALRVRRRTLELVAQILPVRNAGQRIVTREIVELDLCTLALDRVADRAQDDAAVAFPLHEIVLDAAVQDLDGIVLVAVAAQHDDRDERVGLLQPARRTRRRRHRVGAGRAARRRIDRCAARVTASLMRPCALCRSPSRYAEAANAAENRRRRHRLRRAGSS